MQILSVRFLESDCDLNVITACEDTDTCPGCGAGYKAGFIECEYCRRPVNSWLKPAGPHNQALGILG